jgi:hypothetical protein
LGRRAIPADGPDMTAAVKGDAIQAAAAADEGTGSVPMKNRERGAVLRPNQRRLSRRA